MPYEDHELTDETEADWISAVHNERERQIALGYDLEHDRKAGIEHLLTLALTYAGRGEQVQSAALIQAVLELMASPIQSNLVDHATRELEILGEDPWVIDGLINVVRAWADMGHSGGSHAFTLPVLVKLLNFEALTDLTDSPSEWLLVAEDMWQSRRNPAAFSNNGGKTYWLTTDGSNQRRIKKRYKSQRTSHVAPIAHGKKR